MVSETTTSFPIKPGTVLTRGTAYFSKNRKHYLMFQDDGNLVVKVAPADGSAADSSKDQWIWDIHDHLKAANLPTDTYKKIDVVTFDTSGNLAATVAGKSVWWALDDGDAQRSLWLTDSGALQIVLPGGGVVWSSNGSFDTDAPLDGWAKRSVMSSPKITVISTTDVSEGAVSAVKNVYTRMTADLTAAYPKSKFDGYVIYVTNAEPWSTLTDLRPVGSMYSAATGDSSGDWLRGGTTPGYLWITEQMICKTGVATRNQGKDAKGAEIILDNTARTFDQVVHEFAHAIDFRFGLRKRIVELYKDKLTDEDRKAATVRDLDKDAPEEEFAWGVQKWYGVGGTYGEDPTTVLTEIFGTTPFSDTSAFAKDTAAVTALPPATSS